MALPSRSVRASFRCENFTVNAGLHGIFQVPSDPATCPFAFQPHSVVGRRRQSLHDAPSRYLCPSTSTAATWPPCAEECGQFTPRLGFDLRPPAAHLARSGAQVSIHDGKRPTMSRAFHRFPRFNPRPPRGERQPHVTLCPPLQQFQSTLPRGERRRARHS